MPKWLRTLVVPVAVLALVAVACGGGGGTGDGDGTPAPECTSDLKVGVSLDVGGLGDKSFNDAAKRGLDKAIADGLVCADNTKFLESNAEGSNRDENTINLADAGYNLVWANGFAFSEDIAKIAPEYPDVDFAVQDGFAHFLFGSGEGGTGKANKNVLDVTFEENTGSYLVGIAAAMTTKTGTVGFLGGQEGTGLIEKFEAGYIAGAKSINPDIKVTSQYITQFPDFDGFESPDRAKELAAAMYSEGADVVYAAAGLSGSGMFQAAAETSEATGTKVWGIGVDSDQYNTVDPAVQQYVLTSMIKRVDNAVYNITQDVVNGTFEPGEHRYDLAADGVGYATSGGFVDDIKDQLETAKAAIIAGDIVVPTDPTQA